MATRFWEHPSRKFQFAGLTSFLIFLSGLVAAAWAHFAPLLPVVVGGLLSSAALYLTGNLVAGNTDATKETSIAATVAKKEAAIAATDAKKETAIAEASGAVVAVR